MHNVTDNANAETRHPVVCCDGMVGGTTYLFVGGAADDGVSVFSVGAGHAH